jgi:macrodomain Ter protein organizer (MatP/YcbG family)
MSYDKVDSFHIRFTGKNNSAWKFQFKLFVKGKELWGHIDESTPTPQEVEALSKWKIKDARVMTWILSSVEPHLILNLRPYTTAATIWNYLNQVYNQDNMARHFQLEYEMATFTQGSLSIEEYFSGSQNLWVDYLYIVYVNVPVAALSTVQVVHDTSKRDQFLMKLRSDFETAHFNLMNRHPVPSLDTCLSELLCEEHYIVTQTAMEHQVNVNAPVAVAYAA